VRRLEQQSDLTAMTKCRSWVTSRACRGVCTYNDVMLKQSNPFVYLTEHAVRVLAFKP
jgi:hypothetical protein